MHNVQALEWNGLIWMGTLLEQTSRGPQVTQPTQEADTSDLPSVRDQADSTEMRLRVVMYKTRIHTHTTIHINTKSV